MVWALLIIYQIKHFLADYPLQGRYMLGKFKPYPAFILPLLAHSGVHGIMTFLIAVWFKPPAVALLLGALDMGIHFTVDRVKASPTLGGRWTALSKNEMMGIIAKTQKISALEAADPVVGYTMDKLQIQDQLKSNVYFWWALGADQMAHHLTHYAIIWSLLS